mmetsp:Transcript_14978/g.30612  ORF Transcript_14978/g.30612 Transcript_14978/m.30612 type:complete len:221 (+) Transcript_14978:542-1204(+)
MHGTPINSFFEMNLNGGSSTVQRTGMSNQDAWFATYRHAPFPSFSRSTSPVIFGYDMVIVSHAFDQTIPVPSYTAMFGSQSGFALQYASTRYIAAIQNGAVSTETANVQRPKAFTTFSLSPLFNRMIGATSSSERTRLSVLPSHVETPRGPSPGTGTGPGPAAAAEGLTTTRPNRAPPALVVGGGGANADAPPAAAPSTRRIAAAAAAVAALPSTPVRLQ